MRCQVWGRAWSFRVYGDTGPGFAAGIEPAVATMSD